MFMRIGVLDKFSRPLMPCHPAKGRKLLRKDMAEVASQNPFTIRLLYRESGEVQDMEFKLDPGSKETGGALLAKCALRGWVVVMAFVLIHRGQAVSKLMTKRAALRRGRRNRKTRYRKARFNNRRRKPGWLPPSLRSRVNNITALCKKLMRICPITSIAVEQARFDL
jgi:hypothetical protein